MVLVLFVKLFWQNRANIKFKTVILTVLIGTPEREVIEGDLGLEGLNETLLMEAMSTLVQEGRIAIIEINIAYFTHCLLFFHFGSILFHVLFLFLLKAPSHLLILLHFEYHFVVEIRLIGLLLLMLLVLKMIVLLLFFDLLSLTIHEYSVNRACAVLIV